ncbi:MAG: hypothetical protein LBF59_09800 [Prevotellaceae bacterium]|jgi:site-specific DNA-methyltransferase (adenine-specific)|nr:hypothetical protein [Prevotellaceae bacterium]
MKRNYISCELHSEYYRMILDRLNNTNGYIKDEYRIQSIVEKHKNQEIFPTLFTQENI